MLKKKGLKKVRNWLIITVAAKLFHWWFSTCRIRIVGENLHNTYFDRNRKVVAATWHRGAIFLVWFYRKIHPMILFSKSADGDLIAGFAEKLGVIPVRGSSSRGGRKALHEMIRYLKKPGNRKVATVVDGPTGPRYIVKGGMLSLAKQTGQPLLPIVVSAWPAITLKKTWDKTIIPLPFSKVIIMYRKPWHIPGNARGQEFELIRREVEHTLNSMRERSDEILGYRDGS